MGFITTKVKADGTFFLVLMDRGMDGQQIRDAHPPLEKGKLYWGQLLEGSTAGQTQYVEYAASVSTTFKGEELEELPGEYRLIKTSKG